MPILGFCNTTSGFFQSKDLNLHNQDIQKKTKPTLLRKQQNFLIQSYMKGQSNFFNNQELQNIKQKNGIQKKRLKVEILRKNVITFQKKNLKKKKGWKQETRKKRPSEDGRPTFFRFF